MKTPNPQHQEATNIQKYRSEGLHLGVDPQIIDNAITVIRQLAKINPNIATVFTLRHLSVCTGIKYKYLRTVVNRTIIPYNLFYLEKRSLIKKKFPNNRARRQIATPSSSLMTTQKWLVRNVLQYIPAHHRSFAFHPESNPKYAANWHCGCKWLLKVDLTDFFHSITEQDVFRIFKETGFPKLLSFELARITTFLPRKSDWKRGLPIPSKWNKIPKYVYPTQGYLPQGAPTSPMLANLAFKHIDEILEKISVSAGITYTRYADDLAFSCKEDIGRKEISNFRRCIVKELAFHGFKENPRKTSIRGPGTRRIVLGLLVDGNSPRLLKEFKDNLRLHMYYLTSKKFGPSKHAIERGMPISKLYEHISGLLQWAKTVEPSFAEPMIKKFESIDWPTKKND